jgi:hypothetical protein
MAPSRDDINMAALSKKVQSYIQALEMHLWESEERERVMHGTEPSDVTFITTQKSDSAEYPLPGYSKILFRTESGRIEVLIQDGILQARSVGLRLVVHPVASNMVELFVGKP